MKHTKTKSATGSRPLCFYLAPETATQLQEIATREGRPFYQQAARLIETGINAYFEASKRARESIALGSSS